MDDLATRTPPGPPRPVDLASIVLGGPEARRPAGLARLRASARVGGAYEARSVLVLAVVVALLAGVVAWAMHVGRDLGEPAVPRQSAPADMTRDGAPADAVGSRSPAAAGDAQSEQVPVASRERDATATIAPAGADLGIGRIVTSRAATGGGVIRVVVTNRGSRAVRAGRQPRLLVLLDGQVVDERDVEELSPRSSLSAEVRLDGCPAGSHVVAAVVDATGLVAELDERDNAASRAVTFDC